MTINRMLLALLRSAVGGDPLTDQEKAYFSQDQLPPLLAIAKQHDVAHLIGLGLEQNALLDGDHAYRDRLRKASIMAVYRYENLQYERDRLSQLFAAAQIPFVALKGAVISQYYPQPWMRTSGDIDVLVPESDVDRAVALLVQEGWTVKGHKQYHDVALYAPSGVLLELHFSIKENTPGIDTLLEQVWDYSTPLADQPFAYRQTNEYLLFHLLAHASYHFVHGGPGIKPMIDIWLLQQKLAYDDGQLRRFCATCGIETFYDRVLDLIDVWFGQGEHTDVTRQMEHYIVTGGVYGSADHAAAVQQVQTGGKAKNVMRRIFMPYNDLKIQYPTLENRRWLLPVYQLARWGRLLTKGRLNRSIKELKVQQSVDKETAAGTKRLLEQVGLYRP